MAALVTITTFAGTAPPWSLPVLDTDLGNLQSAIQSQNSYSNYAVDSGAANAYITAPAVGITATLTAGLMLQFKAANANTAASTLNHAGLGVKNILNSDGSALLANEILTTGITQVLYDGTQFVLLNPSPLYGIFTSAETAIGNPSTNTTVAHGFAVIPRLVYVVIRNKTAELGYSIGDEVNVGSVTAAGNGLIVYADATSIGVVQGAGAFAIFRKDTFINTSITLANWKLVVRAWR